MTFGPIANGLETVKHAVSPALGPMCVFTGATCTG